MRKLIAAACVFAAGGQALAADLPLPTAQPPVSYLPATGLEWGGFYGGLNGGYAFGISDWTAAAASINSFRASGILVGGTLGLNVQTGAFVYGFEADDGWTTLRGSSSNTYCSLVTAGATCETKSDWLGTSRVRLGYAFDRVLVYGTGGVAFTNILAGLNPPAAFDRSFSVGWTAGAGVEFAFAPYWTVKVEYLYADLGNVSCTTNCGLAVPITVPLTENIVRVGVNYRFGPW